METYLGSDTFEARMMSLKRVVECLQSSLPFPIGPEFDVEDISMIDMTVIPLEKKLKHGRSIAGLTDIFTFDKDFVVEGNVMIATKYRVDRILLNVAPVARGCPMEIMEAQVLTTLHEYAHCITPPRKRLTTPKGSNEQHWEPDDHSHDFWENFGRVLECSVKKGIIQLVASNPKESGKSKGKSGTNWTEIARSYDYGMQPHKVKTFLQLPWWNPTT
eukprot:PhF_6_TR9111/c0_g1_i1/m.14181